MLFANAGLGDFQPIGSIIEESFDRTFGINVKGMVFTVQKALTLMSHQGSVISYQRTFAWIDLDTWPDLELSGTGQKDSIIDDMNVQIPPGRIGQAEEVAAAALFLASDESSFMTGSEMSVDGGFAQVGSQ